MTDDARFWKHVNKQENHWIWTGQRTRSGGVFILGRRPDRQRISARRYAFQLSLGRVLAADENVLLNCDEPNCLRHLRLATTHFDSAISSRFWQKVDKNGPVKRPDLGPCWVWMAKCHEKGYGLFTTGKKPKRKQWLAHRYAWTEKYGPLADGECVLHECDHPPCVRHLFKGTQQDNLADMRAKGKQARGTQLSDLTDDAVRDIRIRCAAGEDQATAGARYGLTQQAVHKIVKFKSWKHVV